MCNNNFNLNCLWPCMVFWNFFYLFFLLSPPSSKDTLFAYPWTFLCIRMLSNLPFKDLENLAPRSRILNWHLYLLIIGQVFCLFNWYVFDWQASFFMRCFMDIHHSEERQGKKRLPISFIKILNFLEVFQWVFFSESILRS